MSWLMLKMAKRIARDTAQILVLIGRSVRHKAEMASIYTVLEGTPAKPLVEGDFGWTRAYGKVIELREKLDQATAEKKKLGDDYVAEVRSMQQKIDSQRMRLNDKNDRARRAQRRFSEAFRKAASASAPSGHGSVENLWRETRVAIDGLVEERS